jgi:hypothetical protein
MATPYEKATSVDDLPLTSAVLTAGARHLGEYCDKPNMAFLRCKYANDGNPKACLDEGLEVTLCARDLCVLSPLLCATLWFQNDMGMRFLLYLDSWGL